MRPRLACAAALLLALTACGGGDSGSDSSSDGSTPTTGATTPSSPSGDSTLSGDEATASQNLKAALLENSPGVAGTSLSDTQAGCVSDGVVGTLGIPALTRLKVLKANLEVNDSANLGNGKLAAEDADGLASVFVDCIDVSGLVKQQLSAQNLTDEQGDCIDKALTDDVVKGFLSQSFQGNQDQSALQQALTPCLTS